MRNPKWNYNETKLETEKEFSVLWKKEKKINLSLHKSSLLKTLEIKNKSRSENKIEAKIQAKMERKMKTKVKSNMKTTTEIRG